MEESSRETLIRMSDIGVCFDGRTALAGVDLRVDKGDFLAISGPNGGGKTTLLKVMLRLLKPTTGEVEYFSDGKPTRRLAIGYLPQKSMIDLKFPISVSETVRTGMQSGFLGRLPKDADERFEKVVELCGIRDYLEKPIGELSGGQLQRTLMARALAGNPEVLVLDEPLSYVDKKFEHQIYHIMERLSKEVTIVLVSHEMSVIGEMANRHLIVDKTVHECHADHHGISRCDD